MENLAPAQIPQIKTLTLENRENDGYHTPTICMWVELQDGSTLDVEIRHEEMTVGITQLTASTTEGMQTLMGEIEVLLERQGEDHGSGEPAMTLPIVRLAIPPETG